MPRPLIGITSDLAPHLTSGRPVCRVALAYAHRVSNAGGVPVLLPPIPDLVELHLAACDAFIFTGGDDPRTEPFGQPTHPNATPMDPMRQTYETALLRALETHRPGAPVLGICLGMQLLSLVSGATLNQHLPDTLATHADHYAREHEVVPTSHPVSSKRRAVLQEFRGPVASHHRQAVSDPGRLEVLARSHDGVIEAVWDPARAFCLGVQWHPERTGESDLGQGLFDRLVAAASTRAANLVNS